MFGNCETFLEGIFEGPSKIGFFQFTNDLISKLIS